MSCVRTSYRFTNNAISFIFIYDLPFSKITAEVNCCHNSPELTIPITIGSIPFVDNYHRIKRRPTISTLDERSKRTTPMPAEFLIDSKWTLESSESSFRIFGLDSQIFFCFVFSRRYSDVCRSACYSGCQGREARKRSYSDVSDV